MGNKLPVSPQVFPFEFASPMNYTGFLLNPIKMLVLANKAVKVTAPSKRCQLLCVLAPQGRTGVLTVPPHPMLADITFYWKEKSNQFDWPFTASTVYLQLQHICNIWYMVVSPSKGDCGLVESRDDQMRTWWSLFQHILWKLLCLWLASWLGLGMSSGEMVRVRNKCQGQAQSEANDMLKKWHILSFC